MRRQLRTVGHGAWFACGFVIWLVTIASIRASGPPPPMVASTADNSATALNLSQARPQTSPAQAPTTATFVGDDTCATCHDSQNETYKASPHHRKADPRTPAARQGCETCHGPGSVHITDPAANPLKQFKKMAPKDVNATCTTCHNRGEHVLWDGSQHESRGLSCLSCHSVHSAKSEETHLKARTQLELCATCHRDKVSKVDRSGHMPVREGKMQCTTCHNVHGATNVRLLRKGDSVAELCTSCHADKRGPFLWEHPPSRDGCATCHDPHGSSNERMLVAKPPILCQRCHVATQHPSTVYDALLVGAGSNPSIRVYARSCVTCHSAIHGSNHPSGQRFIR